MKLLWLDRDTPFPPVTDALSEPSGLLAVGADLSINRLRNAYSHGIFPWYSEGEPLLWWSPDPRMVLPCQDFSASHSLRKRLRQIARTESASSPLQVRVDTAFSAVMKACSAPRNHQDGTWITPEMQAAYCDWHLAGDAHSIETWINDELVGGLYGISLGGMFFGESMFAHATDASKIALAYLVTFLRRNGVAWIDCQQQTRHLQSLGARPVSRQTFISHIQEAITKPAPIWQPGRLDSLGCLHSLA